MTNEYCKCEKVTKKKNIDGTIFCKECDLKIYGCVNCSSFLTLRQHPVNNDKKLSGSLKDSGLYACIVEHRIEDNNYANVYDHENGVCELFTDKK